VKKTIEEMADENVGIYNRRSQWKNSEPKQPNY